MTLRNKAEERLTIAVTSLLVGLSLAFARGATGLPEAVPVTGWDNLPPAVGKSGDWPWWRGPDLNNHAPAKQQPPLRWTQTEGVLWRIELPGKGHATPCINGDRIFLTAGDVQEKAVWLLCHDRATGRKLWQSEVYRGPFPGIHADNSPASATPACDGERIFVPYQTDEAVFVAALDLNGAVLWKKPVGPYKSVQGYSASPAIYRSAIIIPTDGSLGNRLTALHRKTGEVVWRVNMKSVKESYASPLVAHVAGRDQVLLMGGVTTRSYDPNTGKLLWECAGPAEFCAATVAFDSDTVYATAGYPQKALLAIRAGGAGNVTQSHLTWKSDTKAGYVPSPVWHEGLLYAVSDTGLMRCYNAATGDIVWAHDLKASFYSSPVLAGGRIYLFDRKGKGYVMRVGRPFELLAVNELPSGVFATPVILDNRIYLRTLKDFYCLGMQ
jgi:outer membrane protein assembly factor BamB